MMKEKQKTNRVLTIVLILGTVTVFFPLYMAAIIAFKKPSEMTNDVAGALSFPKQWSFENFRQAMEVTDFWRSLGNSLLITLVTIVLAILIHSIAGYVIGRGMARRKSFRFIYLYIVSGMFVPFSILMMPLVKQTAHMGLGNRAGVIVLYLVFYMPMNVLLYSGYLKNIPEALEEAADIDGASTWTTYWRVVFPMMKPMHATVAILTALGTWNDVMTPLVIMSGTGQNTLPLAQLNFQTQFGTNYNLAFASYILALIPILIFYMICQKQIFEWCGKRCSQRIKNKTRWLLWQLYTIPIKKIFTLHTAHTTYQMQVDPLGYLLHLYYGEKTNSSMDYVLTYADRGFSGNPYAAGMDRTYSLDALPQEYPSLGTGDYRNIALNIKNEKRGGKCRSAFLKSYEIRSGKYQLQGLPAVWADENEAQTRK